MLTTVVEAGRDAHMLEPPLLVADDRGHTGTRLWSDRIGARSARARPHTFPRGIAAPAHSGFTLVESLVVIAVLGIAALTAVPRFAGTIAHTRVTSAASVVAGDLELAFSLAARQRRPVRLSAGTLGYTIADRASGTALHRRVLDKSSEFNLSSVSFSRSTIDFFPTGIASGADTISVAAGGFTRRIVMTRAGHLRIIP